MSLVCRQTESGEEQCRQQRREPAAVCPAGTPCNNILQDLKANPSVLANLPATAAWQGPGLDLLQRPQTTDTDFAVHNITLQFVRSGPGCLLGACRMGLAVLSLQHAAHRCFQ